jgi:hypothetical protein
MRVEEFYLFYVVALVQSQKNKTILNNNMQLNSSNSSSNSYRRDKLSNLKLEMDHNRINRGKLIFLILT